MTEAWSDGREALTGFRILRIGLTPERQRLYARIDRRAEEMFTSGLVEETRALIEKHGPGLKVFDTLGYRQAVAFLRGEYPIETAIRLARQGHRNYAKRQQTWFRREPGVQWLDGFGDDEAVAEAAARLVEDALAD